MILAYYNYFSIISIIIILLFVLFSIIGFVNGFMTKFLNIANAVCGLIFSIFFAGKFSKHVIYKIWGDSMSEKFRISMMNKAPDNISNTEELLKELGVPKFIAKMIPLDVTIEAAYKEIGTAFAKVVCVIISFFVLFFGITILCFILKLIVKGLRKAVVIRIVDGILGIIFYDILVYVSICIIFVIFSLIMQTQAFDGFHNFLNNDMNLNTNKFRLSKYLYENNIIGNILRMFF